MFSVLINKVTLFYSLVKYVAKMVLLAAEFEIYRSIKPEDL